MAMMVLISQARAPYKSQTRDFQVIYPKINLQRTTNSDNIETVQEISSSASTPVDETLGSYNAKSGNYLSQGLGTIPSDTADTAFWCLSTGTVLAKMLFHAGHSLQTQQSQLDFFERFVAPSMGRRPRSDGTPHHWQSFMSDDFSPIELSWCWKPGSKLPVVRYAIEPIGQFTGTDNDPYNLSAAHDTIEGASDVLNGLDLGWWDLFYRDMVVLYTNDPATRQDTVGSSEMSQIFLAFDLQGEKAALKAYFLPLMKARQTSTSTLTVIRKTMNKLLVQESSMTSAFEALCQFLDNRQNENKIETEIVAIDCVEPSKSRVKIYVRCRLTTFDSVADIMTMNGVLDNKQNQLAMQELKELWGLVFGLGPKFSTSTPLQSAEHRTAGVLYYFELKPGQALPSPKVYIPVKHYGTSDFEIACGVSTFLAARAQGFACSSYLSVMQSIL